MPSRKNANRVVSRKSIKKIKPRRDCSLLIEVSGEAELIEVRSIAKLGDWDINYEMALPHPKFCKGVISDVHHLMTMSKLLQS